MRECAETMEPEMTLDEQSLLQRLITENQFPGLHLEVGTAAGGSLCLMLKCLSTPKKQNFVVVDRMRYFPDQHQCVINNLNKNGLEPDSVRFITASSRDAYSLAKREGFTFDFALIDAGHKALSVLLDSRWASLLNTNGIICFHDYAPRCPGVMWAVDKFLSRNKNYTILEKSDSLISIKKTTRDSRSILSKYHVLQAIIKTARRI